MTATMFWPLLSAILRLSPTLIIELFVGQRVAPLSHAFKTSDLYKALHGGTKSTSLTHELLDVEVQDDPELTVLLADTDCCYTRGTELDAVGVPERRVVCACGSEAIREKHNYILPMKSV